MNGIYVMLNGNFEHGIGAAYPDLIADNLKPLSFDPQSLLLHYTWSQQANDASEYRARESSLGMNGCWTEGYLIIRACNFVIEDVDKYREENTAKADAIKGQAYAIRALVHFKLVNIFSQPYKFTSDASHIGIPYITTSDISVTYNRQTVGEIYKSVIEDCKNAIELLKDDARMDTRFMNKAATEGLLSRIYLFKEDYVNANSLAVKLINEHPLMRIQDGYPDDIFKFKDVSETETLFQLTPINLDFPNISSFLGRYFRGPTLRYVATNDIAILLNENFNDVRSNWVKKVGEQWEINKYPIEAAPTAVPSIAISETAYYPAVIRSSEMCLIAAESSVKLGNENDARTYLDLIRKRACPAVASITVSGQALLDSIFKERRKELAFEGFRMYDLQRWKLGVHRKDVLYSAAIDLPFGDNRSIAPIPLTEVRLAGLSQNKGY